MNGATKSAEAFDWQRCVAALTGDAKRQLADWRGYSPDFVEWLHREKIIGRYKGRIAFAVHSASGEVDACHYRLADGSWRYFPKGAGTQPLVFGDPASAGYIMAVESQWDGFAVMDKLSWHTAPPNDTAVIITRGSGNARLVEGKLSPDAVVYAFVQNDPPAEKWIADLARFAGCKVLRVTTPPPHKDCNGWTRVGAGQPDIDEAIRAAKPVAAPESHTVLQPGVTDFAGVTAEIRGEILRAAQDKESLPTVKYSTIARLVVEAWAELAGSTFTRI